MRKQLASMAARKSAPSSSGSGSNEEAAMRTLIDLQTFSGAWSWSEDLLTALGIEIDIVDAQTLGKGDLEVAATALAVAFLENKAGGLKTSWEMVVAKARGWMGGQVFGESVDEVVGKAKAYL